MAVIARANHTDGPWTYRYGPEPGHASEFVVGPGNATLAYICPDEAYGVEGSTVEANARLIAAAPELLDVARLVIEVFQRNDASGNFLGDDEHELWNAAGLAVAKAERGEST